MKPHPRIRKTVKWGGVVVSLLLVVVWIGSGWCGLGWSNLLGDMFVFNAGHVTLAHDTSIWCEGGMPAGWHFNTQAASFTWGFDRVDLATGQAVAVPLWSLVLVATFVAAAAWRLDTLARRRARLNLCPKCHYDLTGLADGAVCPECGSARA